MYIRINEFTSSSIQSNTCLFLYISDGNLVHSNAQAQGHPIVYCSDGFCEVTGFARAQVMSKSCACKFLYGEDTPPGEIRKIDEALSMQDELKTEIKFYKKNGKLVFIVIVFQFVEIILMPYCMILTDVLLFYNKNSETDLCFL